MNSSIRIKLSIMMFLQFFVWGAWFTTLGLALSTNNLSEIIGGAYGAVPIAAMIAPLLLGLITDRLFNSEKTMGVLHIIGGILLLIAPSLISSGKGNLLSWLIMGHMLCYMPTLALSNTVAFTNIDDRSKFPALRVWGTIGWIVAGLVIGGLGMSSSPKIFIIGGVSGLGLGVLCFFMPATPPPAKGKPVNITTILMLDAFKMLGNVPFLVFMLCSAAICVPLAYYFAYTSVYLPQIGFQATASTMALGQMSEIVFMLLVPFFFRKLGVKIMIIVGMLAWVARYALFAYGAPEQVVWMIMLGVVLHGICYDFFFVTGFMYTDNKAPKEIRSQAQSLLVFFTQGVGMFFGYKIAAGSALFPVVSDYTLTPGFTAVQESSDALAATIEPATFGFWESFGTMFLTEKPEAAGSIISDAMSNWKVFWMFPCLMALVVTVVFAVAFWDKYKEENAEENAE
ncbi:MAG: MFS transporter [Verrucomicrobiota bacterium]|nr:MFS transporter [Verrucomicrobiota bacterium]